MPASGNLKSGGSFFYITPHPEYQWPTSPPPLIKSTHPPPPPPPRHNHNSMQSLIGLIRTLYEVLHELQTIAIRFYDCNGEITLYQWWNMCENAPETEVWIKKIWILGENGINSKLEHRKAHNSILSGRFGDPYGRPGNCWCMWETPR